MDDIVDRLTITYVPRENRLKWLHDIMCEAAQEIKRLRQKLDETTPQIDGREPPSTALLNAIVHLTQALQDCGECHIFSNKPTTTQWNQYDAALREGKTLIAANYQHPDTLNENGCTHEYESDGGPCIYCGQQGGLLMPNS